MHAVPRLADRHPGLRVVIAGDGPYKDELVDQARRLRLGDTIRFAGFMDSTQLPAVLAATDATVIPSLYEPFGMIALEAAAAGAPLAVARTGGLAEIVEPGVTGVTFPHGDPDALAGAVDRLLADEVFARRVARRARTMVDAAVRLVGDRRPHRGQLRRRAPRPRLVPCPPGHRPAGPGSFRDHHSGRESACRDGQLGHDVPPGDRYRPIRWLLWTTDQR